MSIPTTQKAWIMTSRGTPSAVLKLDEAYPVPTPGQGEVVVKVKYAALNPVGYKTMGGPLSLMRKVPNVVEYDLSGVVVNPNGTTFAVGDEVVGIIPADVNMKTASGAMCQWTVVKEEHLVKKPSSLSFEDAAGLPLVGLTAYGGLLTEGNLQKGQKLFINGGGTSVGRLAVGIAKELGAHVVVSCSESSAETLKSLGADEIVDYKKVSLSAHLIEHHSASPFSLILDLVGTSQDIYGNAAKYLTPEGKYIAIGVDPPKGGVVDKAKWAGSFVANNLPTLLGGVPRKFQIWMMKPSKEGLESVVKWAAEGKIKLQVDSVKSFDKEGVMSAYDRIMSGKATGKVLVQAPE